jgi:D-serine deaminase-like pyridoxal phosphate-dependent protein
MAGAPAGSPTTLDELETPALVLDEPRMARNVERMQAQVRRLGVAFRPHAKTGKCVEVTRRVLGAERGPIAVSTLHEADEFLARGLTDILYAVGIVPGKFEHVARLRAAGCELTVVLDSVEMARALSRFCEGRDIAVPVLIEIDCDGHRSGVPPDSALLTEVAAALGGGATLRGVLTHAGESYNCRSPAALAAMAEQERERAVSAAHRLRAAGYAAPVVSVGSTPTALFARSLAGVTELRAGVFVFFDLVMAGIGVCEVDDIALSVLATVIGHQRDKGWLITDAGWMALSRDRGTARQPVDQGYGLVCDGDGRLLPGLLVRDANQEHGVVARRDGGSPEWGRHPVGSLLRIVPNHACATAAQHSAYRVVAGSRRVLATWERFGGW